MAKCDACGNDYDKSFQVVAQGKAIRFNREDFIEGEWICNSLKT